MKKKLLYIVLLVASGAIQSQTQNLYNFGFDGTTQNMLSAGWVQTNQSATADPLFPWSISTAATDPGVQGQSGGANSFCWVNYQSTTSATGATISNWLISPTITVKNGDVISFYSKKGVIGSTFADRLQLRMSINGAATVNPSTGPDDLGNFTILLEDINPNLNLTSYPSTWTLYSYTISGLLGITDCKFAFRYYVTDGGPSGANSDLIHVDTFSVDRPSSLNTEQYTTQNFTIYPNPSKNILNVLSKNETTINEMKITDLNGRVIKILNNNSNTIQINIEDLCIGVYFLKIVSNQGTEIIKFQKN
ncbi:T9SS-dependent choice-of-anchor J family protein [Flavobacterium sp. N1994]|uniref:T9SS-dependent choice-of-anchor J family protein n=1 Tax=Flavobacterium sp. N1994 TaxID=2986827 RepID=UPI0022216D27|nr:T9SS type A sorting domain-containing protein [Flavobacterium sp. N1994]